MQKDDDELFMSSNLKYLRLKNNKKQDDVGNACGTTFSAISNYEREVRQMDPSIMSKIAKYFNVSVDDFMHKNLRLEDLKGKIKQEENGEIDETHKLDTIVMNKTKKLTNEDKKKLINIMDVFIEKQ